MPHLRRPWRALPVLLATLFALTLAPTASAQNCAVEVEPNDAPATATPLDDRTCLVGAFDGEDQDAWWWVVDEDAAGRFWHLELESIPGQLTRLDVLRIEFAANGVDVTAADTLLGFGTSDGRLNASEPFLVAPGRYLLALAKSGGSGEYVAHLREGDRFDRGRRGAALRDEAGAFANATTLDGRVEVAWTLDEDAAARRWALRAQGALGAPLTLELLDPAGDRLGRATSDELGRLALPGLGLAAGTYRLVLDGAGPVTLDVVATGTITDGDEVEPNDRWDDANVLAFDRPLRATGGNGDHYVFEVGAAEAGRPWDLNVEASSSVSVVLADGNRATLQERWGDSGTLRGLVFAEGGYGLYVDHQGEGPYTLTFTPGAPLQDGFEVEPNDALVGASPMSEDLTVRGSFTPQDDDVFRFDVAGAPQAWRVQAVGEGVAELEVYDPSGGRLQSARADGGRVRLDQLVLLPGTHYVRVSGEAGDYALRVLAQGPAPEPPTPEPDQAAAPEPLAPAPPAAPIEEAAAAGPPPPPGAVESEPNDELARGMLLEYGVVRVGTITADGDVDVYRFHLPQDRPVRIELASPEGAEVFFDLAEAGLRAEPTEPGGLAWMERTLLAGPYEVRVRGRSAPTGWYQLRLSPIDPLGRPADAEPNDATTTASALPADLRVEGYVGEAGDNDHYRLPTFATTVTVEVTADLDDGVVLDFLSPAAGNKRPDADGRLTFEWPAGATYDLRVGGRGRYAFDIAFSVDPDPDQLAPVRAGPPARITFDGAPRSVQAFSIDAQRVEREVTVVNESDRSRTFVVETFLDHPTSVVEAPATIVVPAGGSVTLPVTARLAADLRDDQRLHLSIGLSDALGSVSETLVLSPVCEAPAASPEAYWPLPEPLLGRMNVAWSGLGGRPTSDGGRALAAFDGRATPAYGAYGTPDAPIEVELAGDAVATLVGTVLHPLGDARVLDQARHFEVWTSLDGASYTLAFAGELRAARVAQPFVFDAPVRARFARLVVLDDHQGAPAVASASGSSSATTPPTWAS